MDWVAFVAITAVLIGALVIMLILRDAWKHQAEEDQKELEEAFANLTDEERKRFSSWTADYL